jgi:hypothetical protein
VTEPPGSGMPLRPELFHRLVEEESASVRRRAVELGIVGALALRNVEFESHRAALEAHGGGRTPALWDGIRLHEGREAVEAALAGLAAAR